MDIFGGGHYSADQEGEAELKGLTGRVGKGNVSDVEAQDGPTHLHLHPAPHPFSTWKPKGFLSNQIRSLL